MKHCWMLSATLVLVSLVIAGLTIGCGPDQPEYETTYEPSSFQQQPTRDTSQQTQKESTEKTEQDDGRVIIQPNDDSQEDDDSNQVPRWQEQ